MDASQPTALADDAGVGEINKETGASSQVPIQATSSLENQVVGVARHTHRVKHRRVHGRKSSRSGVPRRPVSAFILFSAEKRREVHEKEPNLKFPEVTKRLSELWSVLPNEEKEPYQKASQASKDRYSQELRKFGIKRSREGVSEASSRKRFKQSVVSKQFIDTSTKESVDAETTKKDSLKPKKKRGRPPKNLQQRPNIVEEPTVADAATSLSVVPITKNLSQRSVLPSVLVPDTDVSIFTDQFLQYNKDLDRDLWQLRRTNKITQEENELLQRSIEELQTSIEQLEERINKTARKNNDAEKKLEQMKSIITKVFSDSYLPEKLTESTVEEFLKKLAGSTDAHIQMAVRTVKHEIARFVAR